MQPSVARVVSHILHYRYRINNIGRLGGNELGVNSTGSRSLFSKLIGFVCIYDHCVVCSTELCENLFFHVGMADTPPKPNQPGAGVTLETLQQALAPIHDLSRLVGWVGRLVESSNTEPFSLKRQ